MEMKKLLFITAVLSLVFGCSREVGETADSSEESQKERAKLEGTWIRVRTESRLGSGGFSKMSFRGREWAREGRETYVKGTYILDPSKSPKWIDLRLTDNDGVRMDSATDKGPVALGIYSLDGDRLIICQSGNTDLKGEARPNTFQRDSGTCGSLSEYERAPEGRGRLFQLPAEDLPLDPSHERQSGKSDPDGLEPR